MASCFLVSFGNLKKVLAEAQKIVIVASGSSRHAGLAGRIMIEEFSGMPVEVEYASEYCCRSNRGRAESLVIVITQSGETADTIGAQRKAQNRGANSIAISNVPDSTITAEADAVLNTYAGPEKAVPATKSFSSQLTILYLLALYIAGNKGAMNFQSQQSHLKQLEQVPFAIETSLERICLAGEISHCPITSHDDIGCPPAWKMMPMRPRLPKPCGVQGRDTATSFT
jgi:glucosamine--fructose-6-phosphate aminotransferase (isomerizing)